MDVGEEVGTRRKSRLATVQASVLKSGGMPSVILSEVYGGHTALEKVAALCRGKKNFTISLAA